MAIGRSYCNAALNAPYPLTVSTSSAAIKNDFFGPSSSISLQLHWRRSVQIQVFMASFSAVSLPWA
jgi:hypothetical protein